MNQKPDSCETDVRYGLLKASRLRKSSYDHLIPTMIQKLKNLRLWSYDVRDFAIHHDQRQSSRTHFHSLPISGRQSSKKSIFFLTGPGIGSTVYFHKTTVYIQSSKMFLTVTLFIGLLQSRTRWTKNIIMIMR